MAPELVLIGTDHYDRNGRQRLQKALEIEKPELVTVETVPAYLNFMKKPKPRNRADVPRSEYDQWLNKILKSMAKAGHPKPHINEVREFYKEVHQYELKVALSYAAKGDIQCLGIDDPGPWQGQVEAKRLEAITYNGSLSPLQTLERSGRLQSQRKIDGDYDWFTELIENSDIEKQTRALDRERDNTYSGTYSPERDQHPASRIRELMQRPDLSKIVSIVGLNHILDDSKGFTLYSLIKNQFRPTRRTLKFYEGV